MKLINATTGKIGNCVIGPKQYLHETINLGEVAICIARDDRNAKPCVWLVGGVEPLIDYVSLARSKGDIEESDAITVLGRLDMAKKTIPTSAIERLASACDITVEELQEIANIAQVCISAPVEGVKDFSGSKPKWLPKIANHASVH